MYELSIEGNFSAAHQVKGYPGDCADIHGHTYRIEARIRVKKLDKIGMSLDFRVVKKALMRVLTRLDHKNLNNLPYFKRHNATAEHIAEHVFREMQKKFKTMHSITVWEGASNKITYYEKNE